MAILNSVADLNALLAKKGIAPVTEVSDFRLTPTQEEVVAYEKENQGEGVVQNQATPEQLMIQKVVEDVIQYYRLDQTPGYYEDEEEVDSTGQGSVRKGVIYQVLNQPMILFEFFKKECVTTNQMDKLPRFKDYYYLAVENAKQMS